MKHLFVDTSGWDALADKADKDHAKALQFRNEIIGKCKLVTTNYILDELYTLLLMNIGFQPTVNYKEKLDILYLHPPVSKRRTSSLGFREGIFLGINCP